MGTVLIAPVENMNEMGSSEFTARAQPCSYVYISYLGPVGFKKSSSKANRGGWR